jgi:hypothetical protein
MEAVIPDVLLRPVIVKVEMQNQPLSESQAIFLPNRHRLNVVSSMP